VPSNQLRRIAFVWPELPHYGARLIRAAIELLNVPANVVSTRSSQPIAGVEEILGRPILWIDPNQRESSWEAMLAPPPDVVVVGGWSTPAFNTLVRSARSRGARVILLMDNPWKGSLRQRVGTIWFRLTKQHLYDALWVPGQAGANFGARLGFPLGRIERGLYGVDPRIFHGSTPLAQRERDFLFIGQLIPRKGLLVLAEALRSLPSIRSLHVDAFGTGPLQATLSRESRLRLQGFLPSHQIAAELARSRFLVLPSLEDHWPLVVLEAAACGCGVVTTDGVDSRHELVSIENGWVYPKESALDLAGCLIEAAAASTARLAIIEAASRRLAAPYSPSAWAHKLCRLLSLLGCSPISLHPFA